MKEKPIKTVNLNYKITEPIDENSSQYQSSSKKYISFTDAQKKAEFFLKSYELLSYKQLYSYIYNCYYEARLSRKKIYLSDDDISESILREDVDRCLKNFEVRGLISYTPDGKFCHDPNCDLRTLAQNGRADILSQIAIWFHIFNSKTIGMEYIVLNNPLSSEILQYKVGNTIFSVSPLPWPGLYNLDSENDNVSYCIEKAKKIMQTNDLKKDADDSNGKTCEKNIFIISENKAAFLFARDSEIGKEKWFNHGIMAICNQDSITGTALNPVFKMIDIQTFIKLIRNKKS